MKGIYTDRLTHLLVCFVCRSSSQPFRPVSARCQVGLARRDVTPPVGIYNRNWGAAEGDVSTGVHMPLYTTALALGPSSDEDAVATAAGPKGIRTQLNQQHSEVLLLVTVDLGWLLKDETEQFIGVICAASGLPASSVLLQLSHTHAGPSMTRPFVDPDCPGGTLAMAWWRDLKEAAAAAAHEAMEAMQPVWLSSAVGHCDLAQKRDLYDLDAQAFITAYNPWTHGEADDTLIATRIQTDDGKCLGTICNYGCHPTSMGHPTSLISPDWPGATRVALEEEYGGICVFILGACGDTMPMQGHQGDPAVTERDGRRVGLAASAALGGLPTTGGVQLEYSGPIISGAVIGQWLPHPFSQAAVAAASAFRAVELEIPVPLRPMETAAAAQATLKAAEARLEAAKAAVAAKLLPATEVVSSDDGDAGVAIGVEAKVEIDLDGVVLRETALAEQARRNFRKISDWQVSKTVVILSFDSFVA